MPSPTLNLVTLTNNALECITYNTSQPLSVGGTNLENTLGYEIFYNNQTIYAIPANNIDFLSATNITINNLDISTLINSIISAGGQPLSLQYTLKLYVNDAMGVHISFVEFIIYKDITISKIYKNNDKPVTEETKNEDIYVDGLYIPSNLQIKFYDTDNELVYTSMNSNNIVSVNNTLLTIKNLNIASWLVNKVVRMDFRINNLILLSYTLQLLPQMDIFTIKTHKPYVNSSFLSTKTNVFWIQGRNFTNDCFIRVFKTQSTYTDYGTVGTNTYNSDLPVKFINTNRIEWELDMKKLFPDMYSREFRIQIINASNNNKTSQLIMYARPNIIQHSTDSIFYSIANKFTFWGYGFLSFDYDTNSVFPTQNLEIFAKTVDNFDLSSVFTCTSKTNFSAEFATSAMTPAVLQNLIQNYVDNGYININMYLETTDITTVFTGVDTDLSHINHSNSVHNLLFETVVVLPAPSPIFSPTSYIYAHNMHIAIMSFFTDYPRVVDEYEYDMVEFTVTNLVPLMDTIVQSGKTMTYTDINGLPATTNNVLFYLLVNNNVTNGKINVAAAVTTATPLMKYCLQQYTLGLGNQLGNITANNLATAILWKIYCNVKYNYPIEVSVLTPVIIESETIKYYAHDIPYVFDYGFEQEDLLVDIPASLFRDCFYYQNSDNGVIITVDDFKKDLFIKTLDSGLLTMTFRLTSDMGFFRNASVKSPIGIIAWLYVYQIRSYLLRNPNAGGPIKNESEIIESINKGLQRDGTYNTIGSQLADKLFDKIGNSVSDDVYLIFNQMTAQSPERFSTNDATNDSGNILPKSFPFVSGDTFAFYTQIGGPINTVSASSKFNNITIKNVFPKLCAPVDPPSSSKEFLLNSDGTRFRPTKNYFKIRLT